MDNINKLSHGELIELQAAIVARLNDFRSIRLVTKWKRCGKLRCYCNSGPADGSWGNLHGPYVFAEFKDRDSGKIRSVSLGRHYGEGDRAKTMEKTLDFSAYYSISPGAYDKMSAAGKNKHRWYVYLSRDMYRKFYGIERLEDQMDRYDRFYGTQANHDAYQAKKRALDEEKAAIGHPWAGDYGVSTVKGQMTLRGLLEGDYYIKV